MSWAKQAAYLQRWILQDKREDMTKKVKLQEKAGK